MAGTTFPSVLTTSYGCVPGGEAAVGVQEGCTLNWGDGMIGNVPLFADAVNGNYRLAAGSPCIDAADNTAVPTDTGDADGDGDTVERLPCLTSTAVLRFADAQNVGDTGIADPPDYPHVCRHGRVRVPVYGVISTGNGSIGLADLQSLLAHYGDSEATYADGDMDGDGEVGLADLQILLAGYGTSC